MDQSSLPRPLSRRALLGAAAGVAVGALGAACGKRAGGPATRGDRSQLQLAQASPQLLAGVQQRVSFGLFEHNDVVSAGRVTIAFGPTPAQLGPPLTAELHSDGIPTRPYFVTTTMFSHPGRWIAAARLGAKTAVTTMEVIDPASTKVPVPGRAMISTPTPTTADPMGVNPICTREPACPLHEVSLDKALDDHRPLAVLFATPALCESRTCGPVLDVLLTQMDQFADRVRFVHVEIYTDSSARSHVPAVDAYGLDFEPILFLAAPDGVVRERLDGPFDKLEANQALTRLVA